MRAFTHQHQPSVPFTGQPARTVAVTCPRTCTLPHVRSTCSPFPPFPPDPQPDSLEYVPRVRTPSTYPSHPPAESGAATNQRAGRTPHQKKTCSAELFPPERKKKSTIKSTSAIAQLSPMGQPSRRSSPRLNGPSLLVLAPPEGYVFPIFRRGYGPRTAVMR